MYTVVLTMCLVKVIFKFRWNMQPDNNISSQSRKLLTLFTSAKIEENISYIHLNTLRNWEQFADDVNLVFYGNDSDLDKVRRSTLWWHARPVPVYSPEGLPILKHLFLDAISSFESDYYGYANSDIMFTDSLVKTLHVMSRYNSKTRGLLITGQRTNVPITKYRKRNATIHTSKAVELIALESGCLFTPEALDYFITSPPGVDWQAVPDIMIGSPGYDNYLMARAIGRGYIVIDATGSILAVHQTDARGNFSGRRRKDGHPNYKFILDQSWRMGMSVCAGYVTHTELSGNIFLAKRNVFFERCKTSSKEHKMPDYKCDKNQNNIIHYRT